MDDRDGNNLHSGDSPTLTEVKSMGLISRRRKRSKAMNSKQGEDRISNLPDSVIGHILSFLPTKYAVATSVLSTKWKDLWTFTTNLEFDDGLLRDPPYYRKSPDLQSSFMNFVDRVLLLCESPRTFHFKCIADYEYDVCRVNSWITSVLKHEDIQKLYLDIPMKQYTRLPEYLFRKETLVELELKREFVMDIAEPIRLPRLKVLEIDSASFRDGDSFTNLLRGCPSLEKLSLTRCFGEDVHLIHICAPVLTSLELHSLAAWDKDPSFIEIKILLETPMLSDLIIDDFLYEYYEFKNLNQLKKAHISLQSPFDLFPKGDIYSKAVDDIFEAVSGVQILLVAGDSMEHVKAIEWYKSRLPTFQHMTKLILRSGGTGYWRMLPLLLEKSPHLKTLTFLDGIEAPDFGRNPCGCCLHEYMFHDESCYQNYFCPQECVPNCLVHHLKIIELGDFSGIDEELRMIEYFLENARVLEKLAIHSQYLSTSKRLEVMSKELLMLPRPSGCEIDFCKTSLWELTHGS